jgi:hypothetical protein
MSGDTAEPPPPSEPAPAAPSAAASEPADGAPVAPIVERRADEPRPPRLAAAVSIGLVLSIAVHALLVGIGLVHLAPRTTSDEEPLPVTIVRDQPPPEKPKEEPPPDKPKAEPPEVAQKPPQPDSKAPAPETQQPMPQTSKPDETAKAQQTPPGAKAAAPATEAPSTVGPPAKTEGGPAAGIVADKGVARAVAMLREQIQRCWTIPSGWTSPRQVTVVLDVRLERSGAVAGRPVLLEFAASDLGMAAAKSALAAVTRCAPYTLPADTYAEWREAQVRLAPE